MNDGLILLELTEEAAKDPKGLVLLRIKLLEDKCPGLPSLFLPLVRQASGDWLHLVRAIPHSADTATSFLARDEKTAVIRRVLAICHRISLFDECLKEELDQEGLHVILSRIMKLDPSIFTTEDDQDSATEIQEMACEIASLSPSFPVRVAPFSRQELLDRLPLTFPILPVCEHTSVNGGKAAVTILINQVKSRQSSQADVGFLMWPSAVALSRYLVTNPDLVGGKDILELGAGCGLTGLVAGQLVSSQENGKGVTRVLLTDYNKVVVKNCEHNILLNGLGDVARAEEMDFYKQNVAVNGWLDSNGTERPQVDLILAADVICQPDDAFAAARTLFCALKKGGQAIFVSADTKHRFGVERFEEACHQVGLRISSRNVRDLYGGQLLLTSDMEKTAGYVEDMNLTMFSIEKA